VKPCETIDGRASAHLTADDEQLDRTAEAAAALMIERELGFGAMTEWNLN
jgi:hypothetical protein